jgi:hypothetical protein
MAEVSQAGVPLASVIEALRAELLVALAKGKGQEVRFALGDIELDFQVEVSQERGGEAGVKFWVVALGGKGSRSSATTHTVRVKLSPVTGDDDDRSLVVGSEQRQRPR